MISTEQIYSESGQNDKRIGLNRIWEGYRADVACLSRLNKIASAIVAGCE